jgi:hypothetical protein
VAHAITSQPAARLSLLCKCYTASRYALFKSVAAFTLLTSRLRPWSLSIVITFTHPEQCSQLKPNLKQLGKQHGDYRKNSVKINFCFHWTIFTQQTGIHSVTWRASVPISWKSVRKYKECSQKFIYKFTLSVILTDTRYSRKACLPGKLLWTAHVHTCMKIRPHKFIPNCTIGFNMRTCFGCKSQPSSGSYKCWRQVRSAIHFVKYKW